MNNYYIIEANDWDDYARKDDYDFVATTGENSQYRIIESQEDKRLQEIATAIVSRENLSSYRESEPQYFTLSYDENIKSLN